MFWNPVLKLTVYSRIYLLNSKKMLSLRVSHSLLFREFIMMFAPNKEDNLAVEESNKLKLY